MTTLRIGFTGTQIGMTSEQISRVAQLLKPTTGGREFHHGDCVGADEQAHSIANHLGWPVVIHPPVITTKRAYCSSTRILPALPYLERNHRIVDATTILIATPSTPHEELRSGTWATVRYARKHGRSIWIVRPDGSVSE